MDVINGLPADMIRTEDAVIGIRDQRQQAIMAQQEQLEMQQAAETQQAIEA